MASGTVAAVYAQALLELADERGIRAAVVDDCRELARSLKEQPDLFGGLEDPRLGKENAKQVIGKALDGKVAREVADLVRLLIDRNRLRDLRSILSEAVLRAEQAAGVVHVKATTAQPLGENALIDLSASLKRALGQGAVLHAESDASLIGGLTLLVDGVHVDGSVRRQLDNMKSLILNAPVPTNLWDGELKGLSL
jgi:F-type H+-transporting ATPase subunit delta